MNLLGARPSGGDLATSQKEAIESLIHVRGISISGRLSSRFVNSITMESFAKALLQGKKKSVVVPQFQLTTINHKRHIQSRIYHKKFGCPETSKRVVLVGSELQLLQTMPFGFSVTLLEQMRQKYNTC